MKNPVHGEALADESCALGYVAEESSPWGCVTEESCPWGSTAEESCAMACVAEESCAWILFPMFCSWRSMSNDECAKSIPDAVILIKMMCMKQCPPHGVRHDSRSRCWTKVIFLSGGSERFSIIFLFGNLLHLFLLELLYHLFHFLPSFSLTFSSSSPM